MIQQPEQKRSAWQKLSATIGLKLEWLQKHPLKGSILAASAGFVSLFLAPLALQLTQDSDAYKAFQQTKPVDKLLGVLGWLAAGKVSVPVPVIWGLGLVAWLGRKRWFKRQKLVDAGEKSPQILAEIADLKKQLEQERGKRPDATVKVTKPKEPSNILHTHPDHRSVISFLFKFKDGTFMDVSREVSIQQSTSQKILKELELDYHFIDRIGLTPQGHIIYALNDNGIQYATDHKMTPGNQSMSAVRASEAEKELVTMRKEFQKVSQEAAQLRSAQAEKLRLVQTSEKQLAEALKPKSAAVPVVGSPTISATPVIGIDPLPDKK